MIKFHPHQYTYFNSIQKNLIKKDFNVDYVGQSIKHSLKYILEKDNRDLVKVSGLGEVWIKGSSLILNETSKSRLDFVNLQQADYIIDIYRPKIGKKSVVDLKRFTKYYDLVIDDKIVNTIYKKR